MVDLPERSSYMLGAPGFDPSPQSLFALSTYCTYNRDYKRVSCQLRKHFLLEVHALT